MPICAATSGSVLYAAWPSTAHSGCLVSSSWSSPTTMLALKLQIQGDRAAAKRSKKFKGFFPSMIYKIKNNLPAMLNSPSLLSGWGCCFCAASLAAPWLAAALSTEPLSGGLRPSAAFCAPWRLFCAPRRRTVPLGGGLRTCAVAHLALAFTGLQLTNV